MRRRTSSRQSLRRAVPSRTPLRSATILVADVNFLTQTWAEKFAEDAEAKGAHLILIVAGFPCKGLSERRGQERPDHKDPYSKLFWCVPKDRAWLKRFANVPVLMVIASEGMQVPPMLTISQTLGCRLTRISAGRVCAAARTRLFWTDFEITPDSDESLERGQHFNVLMLAPVAEMHRLNVVDKGWVLHRDFPGEWPTFIGWRT